MCSNTRKTCRWLREISTAVSILCPNLSIIDKCGTYSDNEIIYKMWVKELEKNKCYKNEKVQDILEYKLDYNEILEYRYSNTP